VYLVEEIDIFSTECCIQISST